MIVRSSVVDAGAAPQDSRRSASRRSLIPGTETIACHCAGTKKHEVTPSRSSRSTIPAGSNPPDGLSTVVPPAHQVEVQPGHAGDVEERRPGQPHPVGVVHPEVDQVAVGVQQQVAVG
jgi:hypothetical protein